MLLSCSRVACCGVAQKTYSPLACSRSVASLAATGAGRRQARSQKSAADLARKDWLSALTPPERNALQIDEATTPDDELVEALAGPIVTDGSLCLVNPSAFVFGIDPDVSGAMAVLRGTDSTIAEVFDVPSIRVMVGSQYRRRHDPGSIVSMIKKLSPPSGSIAYIEQNSPLPKDGKQGWWGSGFGYGIWIGTLVASGISVVPVPCAAWKRAMGLSGKAVTKLKRKKDHGRAEALLIAAYGKGIPVLPEISFDEASSSNSHDQVTAG